MAETAHTTFNLTLDSMRITDTRSRHEDTDYVSFTLLTQLEDGKHTTHTIKKKIGDVNNGTHPINMTFAAVRLSPGQLIVMNYIVINSGHADTDKVYSTLQSAGSNLASAGFAAAGGAIGTAIPLPGIGTLVGAIGGWLTGQAISLIFANCDGPVAAEQVSFTYQDLLNKTAHGKFTHETKHPGTDSASGCGSNSMYYTTWHIEKIG